MNWDKVVLVDADDNALGEMDKLEAHELGKLHRAFSVFIFNDKGEMLLQQRAHDKYHGAGLWTNACCSHPGWKENVKESAIERLEYEMGLKCNLQFLFSFVYKAEVENHLTEYEFDHVFTGTTNSIPSLNTNEVAAYKWMQPQDILQHMAQHPENYTVWFRKLLRKVLSE